jgi:uncharacterized protein
MDAATIRRLEVIDADTHVLEPADLWTSRMSAKKWGALIPHIKFDKDAGEDLWFVGDTPIFKPGVPAMAGWHEYAPDHPKRLEEFDPHNSDPVKRLQRMDEYGIWAQVLYPNVGIFAAADYLGVGSDPAFALECVKAYNDFLVDWAATDRKRYVPVMMVPFWDLDEAAKELSRAKDLGHRGIVMSSQPENYGLPPLDHRHWDGLWAAAEEMGLPVNFHIGSGKIAPAGETENGVHANYAWMSTMLFMGNIRAICALVFSGICHRFPRLNFVSVESGVGWLPSLLETMDWQWLNSGVPNEHPEYDLLPSEYFRRQVYGCFWFERGAARAALDLLGPDNILYETDFPHPTSMSPGPASTALKPLEFMEQMFAGLPDDVVRKVVHDNAARLYGL